MRRRSSRARAAATAASLASLWFFSATGASSATSAPILRIELENFEQMQFVGRVSVGSPPQEFRVIFDTGSSDVWLADEHCASCAASARRYAPAQSSTFAPSADAFRLEYGSGVAAGVLMRETLRLGGTLEIAHVRMGQVNATTERLRSFHADGIVGLGLVSLALITKPGLFTLGESTLLSTFSIYINPVPSSTPPSQLILGGIDPAMAALTTTDQAPQWHYFPLVAFPETTRMGFWAIHLKEMTIAEEHTTPADDSDVQAGSAALSRGATVIVDSGTSLILLPPRVFNATIDAIAAHLQHTQNTSLVPSTFAVSGFACKGCSPRMFPRLAFTFDSTAFHLQGVDYVRCDGASCSPQLDSHSLFQHGHEPTHGGPHEKDEVIVLGAVFLRAYYTVFDAHRSRVGFACARGGCRGGRLPEMRFAGGVLLTRARFWRRAYFAAGAMLVLLALALLWQLLPLELPSPSSLRKETSHWREPSNGDCHRDGSRESEPEGEPPLVPWSSRADSSSLAPRGRRRASQLGMELLRRLSSTLAIVVVVTSDQEGSDSEESAHHTGEPELEAHATFRADLDDVDPKAATAQERDHRPPTKRPWHSSGNTADDQAFQKTHDEGPVRILTANPEVPTEGMPRIRRSSVCLDA